MVLHLRPALALELMLVPRIYVGPDTAPRSERPLPTKKRSVAGTTTCAYIVDPPAIGLLNTPIRDLGESPQLLLPLPPLPKEAY